MWLAVLFTLLLGIVGFAYFYYARRKSTLPPGIISSWRKEYDAFVKDPIEFITSRHRMHGTLFATKLGKVSQVVVLDESHADWLLKGHQNYLRKIRSTTIEAALFGDSPIEKISPQLHSTLVDALSQKKMIIYLRIVESKISDMLQKVHNEVFSSKGLENQILLFPHIEELVVDLLAEIVLGVQLDQEQLRTLQLLLGTLNEAIISREHKGVPEMSEWIKKNWQEAVKHRDQRSCSVFHSFYTHHTGSDTHLESEIQTLLFFLFYEGYQTIAAGMTSIATILTQKLRIVAQLEEEMKKHNCFSQPDSNSPVVSIKNMTIKKKMISWELANDQYLNCFIKEVLRVYSPVLGGWSILTRDTPLNGYIIPKGWRVATSVRSTHFNPTNYNRPALFDPERWKVNHPFLSFGPLNNGRETCLGKELANTVLKIWTILLVRDYQVIADGEPQLTFLHPFAKLPRWEVAINITKKDQTDSSVLYQLHE